MTVKQVRDVIKRANQLHTIDLHGPNTDVLLRENSELLNKLQGLNYSYTWACRANVDRFLIKQCLELVRGNMMKLYNESKFCGGWNDRSKLQILSANSNFYFLIIDSTDCLVGFICYRFIAIHECQPITPVCYIFEIQLRSDCCGNGVGQLLIKLAQKVANKYKLSKVMCTCIKSNTRALNFYYKCGFTADASDPDTCYKTIGSQGPVTVGEACYKILKL